MSDINDKPLVSVIMSVYNTPVVYLRQATESILNQTYINIEFIIVDDGSTDTDTINELDIIVSNNPCIVQIYNENNIGLTKSLNKAIKKCNGKYIARMDADDISLPNRLENQVEYMEQNPEIVLCGANTAGFCDGKIIYDSSLEYHRCKNPEVRDIHLVFENEGFAHPTFMLRRQFLIDNNILYREDIPHAQDYGMTTDCILNGGKIGLVDKTLLLYRVHEGQITSHSYASQVECQARIAYSRIKKTFESLTDEECWAIARLNHESDEYEPDVYIRAIKKIIKENKERKLFNQNLLVREYRYEWYRKYMRMTRIFHKPWGMNKWFSVNSVFYAIVVKIKDNVNKSFSRLMTKREYKSISNYYKRFINN